MRRNLLGTSLLMPWSHLLPEFVRGTAYGKNLIGLAVALTPDDRPLKVLDIGANIGDSAASILAATDAELICVEADPYWAGFLRMNVGANPRVRIEEALLVSEEGSWADAAP